VWTALVIFLFTYLFLAGGSLPRLHLDRTGAAFAGAVAMVAFGVLTPAEAAREAINWDTIFLLLGMSVLSGALARAGVFKWVSWRALHLGHGAGGLLTLLTFVSAGLSALLVNDTVCLMCTPLVLALIDDAQLPPWPFLLALAFGANAGSVATPIGNPQNMLVATLSGIGFVPFTAALLLPALAATLSVALVLRALFARELAARGRLEVHLQPPQLDRRQAAIALLVLALVVLGFLAGRQLAWTALAGAALIVLSAPGRAREALAKADGLLLLFFAALFVVTHAVAKAGIAELLYARFQPYLGTGALSQTVRFGAFTLAACQLVSNVPFVLLAGHWIPRMAEPHLAWLSLALVSTLAGNLTPVASVANLIVLEGAGERGRIPFGRFLAAGAAATVVPLLAAFALLWLERLLFPSLLGA
jgi:Na+/H+ antiporter NhaD/arsenite permease-like protein